MNLWEEILKSIIRAEKFCKQNNVKNEVDNLVSVLEKALNLVDYRDIPGHSLEHMFRVLSLSLTISCFEGGDKLILALASILHDIGRFKEEETGIDHAELSARIAEQVLKESPFSNLADKVARIIREHRYKKNSKPSCIESAILQDADRIDALGFIGVARVFSYGGYKNRTLKESLKHFDEKIKKLPKLMNTETGRKIALVRAEKVNLFLEELEKELNLNDVIS